MNVSEWWISSLNINRPSRGKAPTYIYIGMADSGEIRLGLGNPRNSWIKFMMCGRDAFRIRRVQLKIRGKYSTRLGPQEKGF